MDDVRWLDEEEQLAWRKLVSGMTVVQRRLEKDLLDAHGISSDDYAILVLLSESPDRAMRMSQIAELALVPKPQVTYRVRRLEEAGTVVRTAAEGDARGTLAVLTDAGFALLEAAARHHVSNVRDLILDQMSREEFLQVGDVFERIYRVSVSDDCAEALRA